MATSEKAISLEELNSTYNQAVNEERQVTADLASIASGIKNCQSATTAVTEFYDKPDDNEPAYIPLADSIMLRGTIDRSQKLMVSVGSQYHTERDKSGCLRWINDTTTTLRDLAIAKQTRLEELKVTIQTLANKINSQRQKA